MLRVGLHRNKFNQFPSRFNTLLTFLFNLFLLDRLFRSQLDRQLTRAVSHNVETEQILRNPSYLQRTEEPTHHLLAY